MIDYQRCTLSNLISTSLYMDRDICLSTSNKMEMASAVNLLKKHPELIVDRITGDLSLTRLKHFCSEYSEDLAGLEQKIEDIRSQKMLFQISKIQQYVKLLGELKSREEANEKLKILIDRWITEVGTEVEKEQSFHYIQDPELAENIEYRRLIERNAEERRRQAIEESFQRLYTICSMLLTNTFPSHPIKLNQKKLYTEECFRLITEASESFKNGQTFFEIYDGLAKGLERVRIELYKEIKPKLGYQREGVYKVTSSCKDKMLKSIPSSSKDFKLSLQIDQAMIDGITVRAKVGDKVVPLTQYIVSRELIKMPDDIPHKQLSPEWKELIGAEDYLDPDHPYMKYQSIFGKNASEYPSVVFQHLSINNIPHVFNHIEELVENLRTENNIEKIVKIVAEVHWWAAHSKIMNNHSSVLQKMVVEALFLSKGITVEWKEREKGSFEAEAIATPNLEEYVAAFPQCMIIKTA